jgi:FHA domain
VWDKRALMDAAAKLALREFLVRFRGYYLVSFQGPTADSASFRTSKMRIERPSRNSTVEEIRKIAKAPGNPYKDRISVGRAQNCDVVIRHASISKLHAHFRARPGGFDLTDLESKNHTVVNGERLLPAVASAVTDGDILQFGAIEVQLATAEAVYRWIHVP